MKEKINPVRIVKLKANNKPSSRNGSLLKPSSRNGSLTQPRSRKQSLLPNNDMWAKKSRVISRPIGIDSNDFRRGSSQNNRSTHKAECLVKILERHINSLETNMRNSENQKPPLRSQNSRKTWTGSKKSLHHKKKIKSRSQHIDRSPHHSPSSSNQLDINFHSSSSQNSFHPHIEVFSHQKNHYQKSMDKFESITEEEMHIPAIHDESTVKEVDEINANHASIYESPTKAAHISNFFDVVQMSKEGCLARMEDDNGVTRIFSKTQDVGFGYRYTSGVVPWYIICPDTGYIVYWDLLIVLILFYYTLVCPLLIGFPETFYSIPRPIEITFTSMFSLDIIFQFFTAYPIKSEENIYEGEWESMLPNMMYHYLITWFPIDFTSTLPLDLMFSHISAFSFFRLLRLLRIPRVLKNLDRMMLYFQVHPSTIRLLSLIFGLLLMLHVLACVYWRIVIHEELLLNRVEGEISWAPSLADLTGEDEASEFWTYYQAAFLWAIWSTTGTGWTGEPENSSQYSYTILATLMGVLMYAFIVGSASSALQDIDSRTKEKELQLQQIKTYLDQRNAPKTLTNAIVAYYEYIWERNRNCDMKLFEALHPALEKSLHVELNKSRILKVPMFHDIPKKCLGEVIGCITSRIYLPGEWVIIKGDIGKEMFFVVSGKFHVLPDMDSPPLVTLLSGQSFGEMSLLMEKKRNSSVQSVGYGELMVLHKNEFEDILQFFPVFAISLQKWAPHIRLSRGWDKIRHAIRLCQSLGQIGMHESFTQMIRDINGVKGDNYENTRDFVHAKTKNGFRKFKKSFAFAQDFFTLNANIANGPKKQLLEAAESRSQKKEKSHLKSKKKGNLQSHRSLMKLVP